MQKIFLLTASLFGAVGVTLGAMGAHFLSDYFIQGGTQYWATATLYLFIHTLALLFLSIHSPLLKTKKWAGTSWACGIILFSGSLYSLALDAPKWLGAITPIGGLLFISGWLLLAVSSWNGKG